MSRSRLARFVNPWKFKREQRAERIAALRDRDGENCRRCRRPMRFDLPPGHDAGANIERIATASGRGPEPLDNFCLTHGHCNANSGGDDTEEVQERVRLKAEAALFERSRETRKTAAE